MSRFIHSNFKKIVLVLALGLLIIPEVWSQSFVLEGTVIDQADKQPLEFSTISLFHSHDSILASGTVSDAKGKFVLRELRQGSYYMVVQFLGYESKTIPGISLNKAQSHDLGQITLIAGSKLLEEITVNGEKANSLHQIDKQVYKANQFQAAQGGTATDVLKNLPSVAVNSEGDISMRGSADFIVLIDGKPVQTDAAVILGQLPANSVENVEIITTPSSKYDPDGKAGIINITTKRGTSDGWYLLLNAQGGLPSVEDYGNANKPVRFGGDFTANYKKNKWNVSLSANYKREDIAGYRVGEAETYLNNILTTLPSTGERSYESYAYSLKGTANYQINKTNILEAGFYAGKKSQFRTADILYQQRRINQSTGELLHSFDYFNQNLRERKGDFVISNIDYRHVFANKSDINISALYEKTILGGPTNNQDVNPENWQELYTHSVMEEENPLDGVRIKADYTLPLQNKAKLETGYQYRYLLHKGEFKYNELNVSTSTWAVRPDLSNAVELTRQIHSLYSQFANETGKLSYSAGLRLEYIDRVLEDASSAKPYVFERLNLFPSANLLYTLSKGYKLKAGYSRRIVHTTSNMMNPFPARRHSEVLEVGDPTLLPEYINVAELGAVKDFGSNSLFATFYYQGTQHIINRVNNVYNDTILVRTYTNAGNATALGLEVGVDLKPTKWWNLYAGGNVYNYSIKGEVFNNQVNTRSLNYSLNANTTFKIVPSLTFQLNVNYLSRTVTAQGEDSRFLIPNATLKKSLLDGRASISLQWSNIDMGLLETNEQRMTTRRSDFYTSTNYIQEVDIFRINFSYQLNKLANKLKFTESEFGEKEF